MDKDLFTAIKDGDTYAVRSYSQSELSEKRDPKTGQTLLHAAAGYGRKSVVSYLLDIGLDVNIQDKNGLCPLHNACCHMHYSTSEILLERGANPNLVDNHGWSPLHFALSRKVNAKKIIPLSFEVTKLLLRFGADPYLRTTKTRRSCFDRINDENDKRLLKMVYLSNRLESCDVGERENVIDNCLTVQEYFEELKGGDITDIKMISTPKLIKSRYKDRDNITALHRAAGYSYLSVAKFLVSKGAEVNALDSNGRIPLHNAAQYGHLEMIRFLVKEGSNVNTQDVDGRTPLHVAALLVTYEACLTLINLGANLNIKDLKGDIAYDLADSSDVKEVLKPKEQMFTTQVGNATYVALPVSKRDQPVQYSTVFDQLMMDSSSDQPLFTSTDKHHIKKIILLETDERYQLIKTRMLKTIVPHDSDIRCQYSSYEILSIELILNQKVWTNYQLMCQILENEDGYKNEKLLFHGSNFIDNIQNNGFDERYAQRDGMFGTGIYFARHSSKSNQYTFGWGKGCQEHNDTSCYICERQMIYAQVALGRSLESKQAMPDCSHGPPGFSSVTGLPGLTDDLTYHEYVIYKGAQAYPLFVIRYRIKK